MGKRAARKDFYMEIRKSSGRFLSIFFIVALGVAFFSGIRSSQPDMLATGDAYFDASDLMDVQAVSTLGITKGDVKAVEDLGGVEKAEGGYSMDVLCRDGEKQKVLHIMSMLPTMNQVKVTKGRLPEKPGECLADDESGYKAGDTIKIESGTDNDVKDSLKTDTLKVVGTGSSPCYISFGRGSSMIGTGSISGFVIVPESTFDMDVYTEMYVSAKGAQDLLSHSKAYEKLVKQVQKKIEGISGERGTIRRDELTEEAEQELEKARKELEDGEQEAQEKLNSAAQTLADGEQQLQNANMQVADGAAALEQAKSTLQSKQKELDEARVQYEDGMSQLQKGKASFEQGTKEYQENIAQYGPQIETGKRALQDARQQLEDEWAKYEQLKLQVGSPGITEEMLEQMRTELEAGEQEYNGKKAALESLEKSLQEAAAKLESKQVQLSQSENTLAQARSSILDGQIQIDSGWETISGKENELQNARSEIAASETELQNGREEYDKALQEAKAQLEEGKQKIADGEEEIAKIEKPTWYVNDRSSLPAYTGFGDNADRMKAIGRVFPVLFFLVAALISLTSMTRMVEEQRVQIGTMKALGYSKLTIASKYLGYAFLATVGGSVLGVLAGEKILPYIIIYAYGILYHHISDILVPYNLEYAAMASAAAIACTMAATSIACYKELAAQPAILMRPPSPKKGKRVFMERMTFIWKHLSFIWKSTIRNLFRYKKRFFMTVFGIGGCMALILVGFGLKDSIFSIAGIQYEEIEIYDGAAYLQEDADEEQKQELHTFMEQDRNIERDLDVYVKLLTLEKDGQKWDTYTCVPENTKDIDQFVKFRDRKTQKSYALGDQGVILSEKTAKLLKAEVGDVIKIKDKEYGDKEVTIADICENYMGHYMYLSPNLYEDTYGQKPEFNSVYFTAKGDSRQVLTDTGEKILSQDAVLNVSYLNDVEKQLDGMLNSLNLVIIVLIVSAGMLSFVVLYNLNTINIAERQRELATIKVLGFYDSEVSAYVYRENIILTFVGAAAGIIMGIVLHRFIIQTVEVDDAMFGRIINLPSYLYSTLFTFAFSFFVNWVMYFKLKKINMVESLKSIE